MNMNACPGNPLISARVNLTATILLMLGALAGNALASPAALQDQNGKSGGMEDFSGQPVIVFVTSLTQLEKLGKWEEALRPEVPDINSMDIGDIKKPPDFVREEVVKVLRKKLPEGVSVYIDDDNLWEKEYKLDLSEPNVLVFDAQHELIEQFSGKPAGKVLDDVIAAAKTQFPSAESGM